MNAFTRILIGRAARNAVYGAFSVVFALVLAHRGYSSLMIGVVLSIALLAGAVFSLATGKLVIRFGRRRVVAGAGLVMGISGALFAWSGPAWISVIAVLLGTVSAGTQEVGPFSAVEQTYVAEYERGAASAKFFTIYNLVGAFAIAIGALLAGFVGVTVSLWAYAVVGFGMAALYLGLPANDPVLPAARPAAAFAPAPPRFGIVERLTALFGVDALAGGFVVQS
ncbi:MAG: MFS transporter, partial [Candidatus Dormibacteria bacterium]